MRRVGKYIFIICAAVLLCGCYNYIGSPDGKGADVKPDMSLAELRGLWRGHTFKVAEPIVVGGVVTSSDGAGNFYQTFTIEDNTGAAEIMAGMRDLHNTYPVGCRVSIKLDGCAVGVERGVVQIGLMPASYSNYAVDYFYSKVLLDKHIVRSGELVEVQPLDVAYGDLSADKCGRLVRLEALQFQPEEGEQTLPATWMGYRAFADRDGNVIYVYTSNYADYAGDEVPLELCSLTGILQYGEVAGVSGEWFILKMRSADDCVSSSDCAM